jgi:hypothetical protein
LVDSVGIIRCLPYAADDLQDRLSGASCTPTVYRYGDFAAIVISALVFEYRLEFAGLLHLPHLMQTVLMLCAFFFSPVIASTGQAFAHIIQPLPQD